MPNLIPEAPVSLTALEITTLLDLVYKAREPKIPRGPLRTALESLESKLHAAYARDVFDPPPR